MSVLTAGMAGVAAGLGVAVPLGAVGVLLVSEGMTRGWAAGSRAAAGVATVDLVYAGAAVAAGAGVTAALSGVQAPVRLLAAAVLAAVAVRGLLAARAAAGVGAAAGATVAAASPSRRTGAGPYWRFVAVTAVNPLTALYFVALAAGLGERLAGRGAALAFVLGVGAGSLAWQLVLAAAGAGAGAAVGERGRRVTAYVGNAVVLLLALGVALSAVAG